MPKTSRTCRRTLAWATTGTLLWAALASGRRRPSLGLASRQGRTSETDVRTVATSSKGCCPEFVTRSVAMRKSTPPRKEMTDESLPFGRAGTLRGDGRSRPQDDFSGALCDGEARHPYGPGNRRRPPEVESGPSAQARDGKHRTIGRGRQPACPPPSSVPAQVRQRGVSSSEDVHGDKERAGQSPAPGALPRYPALALRDGDQRTRCRGPGRACARCCRKAVRTRPGIRAGAVGLSSRFRQK